jgi:hypothetical protein
MMPLKKCSDYRQDILDITAELEELNLPYSIDLSILETIENQDLPEETEQMPSG